MCPWHHRLGLTGGRLPATGQPNSSLTKRFWWSTYIVAKKATGTTKLTISFDRTRNFHPLPLSLVIFIVQHESFRRPCLLGLIAEYRSRRGGKTSPRWCRWTRRQRRDGSKSSRHGNPTQSTKSEGIYKESKKNKGVSKANQPLNNNVQTTSAWRMMREETAGPVDAAQQTRPPTE